MKNIIFAIAMSSASALLGEVWYSNVNESFGNAGEGDKALADMSYWTKDDKEGSGQPTSSDDLVFNGAGGGKPLRIRMLAHNKVLNFTGNSFQLGTDEKSVTVVYDGGQFNFNPEAEGLKLKHGLFWINQSQDSEKYPIRISGKAHVFSNESGHPFVFNIGNIVYTNKKVQLDVSLFGDPSAWLLFGPYPVKLGDTTLKASAANTTVMVRDISNYDGLITVTSVCENVETDFGMCLKLDSATSSATIDVCSGGSLSAYDFSTEITVKNLSMAPGTRLWFNQSEKAENLWRIKATDSIDITGKVQIYMDTVIVGSGKKRFPILEGPASSFTEEDFELVYPDRMAMLMDAGNMSLKVEEENGRCVLFVEAYGFIDQLSSKPKEGDKSEDTQEFNQSSFTNELAWRDGLLPGSVTAPGVPDGSRLYYTDKALRTTFEVYEDYVFPADALFLDDGGKLIIQKKSFQVPVLYCRNADIGVGQSHPSASKFPVRLVTDRIRLSRDRNSVVNLRSYTFIALMVEGEIEGAASLNLEGWSHTGAPRAEYGLTGLNTNFTGSITVSQLEYRPEYISFDNHYPTLHVYDGRNLGGRMESFEPRALTLTHMARLSVTNGTRITLEKNLNRGAYILEKGRFHTTRGSVLDVQWPVLLSGTMWKEGPGTLVLGGAMRHEETDGGEITDIPRAGSNAFEVVEGVVEIAHVDAVAGAEMRIASKASLKLAVDPENAELFEYGIRNTSTDTPFVLDESFGGKMPLSIDWSKVAKSDAPMTVGLVTVKKELQDAVLAMMPSLRPPWTGISYELVTIDRGADEVTVALKVRPIYMRIIIR